MLFARLLLFFLFAPFGRLVADELPRPRAPRLLRLEDERGRPLRGDCLRPHFSRDGQTLLFARDDGKRSSLWLASPPATSTGRYPAWRARPLLGDSGSVHLEEGVAYVRGDGGIVAVGGEARRSTQLLLATPRPNDEPSQLQTLWSGRERLAHPALSPNERTVVFTRYFQDPRSGRELPQLWRTPLGARGDKPVLVAKNARRAFWLGDKTLAFERLEAGATAFYTLNPWGSSPPQLLLRGSGEGTGARGAAIVFAARSARATTTSLYLLARDGSGLRQIAETPGARRPSASRDGNLVAFDAPDPSTKARALWLLPLDWPAPDETSLQPAQARLPPSVQFSSRRCQVAPMPLPPPALANDPAPPTPTPQPSPTPTPTPDPNESKADMDVAGTLASVAANAKMRVELWAKNRGTRAWTPQNVRVVARWVDFEAGTRRRWEFKWMRGTVKPLEQTRFPLELSVPARPGRYKLIYGLIRLPSDGAKIEAPNYDAPQDAWPGEFAATAFAVNVK